MHADVRNLIESNLQEIPEHADFSAVLISIRTQIITSQSQTVAGTHVLGPRTDPFLLTSSEQYRPHGRARADVERTGSFRSSDLMAGQSQDIHIGLQNIGF